MQPPEAQPQEHSPIPLQVSLIPVSRVKDIWVFVKDRIEDACLKSDGTTTLDGVLNSIMLGEMQLWVTTDARMVAVTQINIYQDGRKYLTYIVLSGFDFDKYRHLEKQIEDWSKQYDCIGSELYGRPGWVRKLGNYRAVQTLLRRDYGKHT